MFAQIVADELGVDVADVYVTTGDTRRFPYAVGTYASRAAVMSGNAVALAARAVRAKAVRIAAEALEAAPEDLDIEAGWSTCGDAEPGHPAVAGGGAVQPAALLVLQGGAGRHAVRLAGRPRRGAGRRRRRARPGGPRLLLAGALDVRRGDARRRGGGRPDTGRCASVRYAVVHDCGPLINPMMVEGQIHGGVAQGVAGALLERLAYDEAGNLANASFMDFLMPYLSEVPVPEIGHQETRRPSTRWGSRARARPA